MKQTDVTVTFYLKKSEMNDEGHCPVMAKLVVGKFSEAAFSILASMPDWRIHIRSSIVFLVPGIIIISGLLSSPGDVT